MDLQAKLDATIREHNELHANIQAGEQQLATMKEQRQQLLGRVSALQEILQEAAVVEEGDTKQLIETDDPTEE